MITTSDVEKALLFSQSYSGDTKQKEEQKLSSEGVMVRRTEDSSTSAEVKYLKDIPGISTYFPRFVDLEKTPLNGNLVLLHNDPHYLFFKPLTPLVYAISIHSIELARLLLQQGADPNLKDEQGYTPISLFYDGPSEMIELLFSNGADFRCKSRLGGTVFDCILRGAGPGGTCRIPFDQNNQDTVFLAQVYKHEYFLKAKKIDECLSEHATELVPKEISRLIADFAFDISQYSDDNVPRQSLHLNTAFDAPKIWYDILQRIHRQYVRNKKLNRLLSLPNSDFNMLVNYAKTRRIEATAARHLLTKEKEKAQSKSGGSENPAPPVTAQDITPAQVTINRPGP